MVSVAIVVCALLCYQKQYSNTMFSCALYPILYFNTYCVNPLKNYFLQRHSISELTQTIEVLTQKCALLQSELIQEKATADYARDIQEVVRFRGRYNYKNGIITQVLMHHITPEEHYFLIDAGSSQGITEDMIVVFKNCLVGKVCKTYPWYSKVMLVTDKSCKVSVYTQKTRIHGVHEGINLLHETKLAYVDHLAPVKPGEYLISSGQGTVYPRGLCLGRVATCTSDGLYLSITVTSCVDLETVSYCLVVPRSS